MNKLVDKLKKKGFIKRPSIRQATRAFNEKYWKVYFSLLPQLSLTQEHNLPKGVFCWFDMNNNNEN